MTTYQNELSSLINEFDNLIISIDSNINQELLKTTFRDISSLIQRLGMKLLIKDFFEADIVFNELLNKTTIINKLGILK